MTQIFRWKSLLNQGAVERLTDYGPKAVNLIMLGLLAAVAAELTWLAIPAPEETLAPQQAKASAPTLSQSNALTPDFGREIAGLHLFGQYVKPKVAPRVAAPVKQTRLNLKLRGIFASGAGAYVIIAEANGKERVYSTGEKLPGGAVLKEIHRDKILLSRNGGLETLSIIKEEAVVTGVGSELETLGLPGEGFSGGGEYYPGDEFGGGEGFSPGYEDPGQFDPFDDGMGQNQSFNDAHSAPTFEEPIFEAPVIDDTPKAPVSNLGNMRQQLMSNPATFLASVNPIPVRQGGQFVGYKMMPGRDPRFFQQVGLRAGDVVTGINGIHIDSESKGITAMQSLAGSTQDVQVNIRRNGVDQTLILPAQ